MEIRCERFLPKDILNLFWIKGMLGKKINIGRFSFVLFLLFLAGTNISCEEQQGTQNQSRTDLPPVITSISISPNQPNGQSELGLFIQSRNPGGNPLTYRYQWIKNDQEISGENKNTLKSGNFVKGDLIQVKVIPSDGRMNGEPFLSGSVKISDMPPLVEEVHIEPKLAYANSDLKAIVRSSDPDGDTVTYLYQWEKNGNVLSEGESEILESNRFKRGDSITVTVTPNDGEKLGKPKKSEAVIIANSPPIIASSPPTKLNGNIYAYQVKTEDPDSDPIIFGLKTAPKGMVINKEIGLIKWEVSKGDLGDHLIEIEATDPEGGKSIQRYTLTIKFR
jgi:hypothetical protein